MRVKGDKSSLKLEQGKRNKEYLYHLFEISKKYVLSEEPKVRLDKEGNVKSYYFTTFTHKVFNKIKELFIKDGKKWGRIDIE